MLATDGKMPLGDIARSHLIQEVRMDSQASDEKRKLCSTCGAELVPGGPFCLVCGTNNSEGAEKVPRVAPTSVGGPFQKIPYPFPPIVLSDDFIVPRMREEKKNSKFVIVMIGFVIMIIMGSIILITYLLLR